MILTGNLLDGYSAVWVFGHCLFIWFGEMKTKFKFIHFEKSGELFDKDQWHLKNNKSGELLGAVEFYPEWNQYVLFTVDGIVFSQSCLLDIVSFINQLQYYKEPKIRV